MLTPKYTQTIQLYQPNGRKTTHCRYCKLAIELGARASEQWAVVRDDCFEGEKAGFKPRLGGVWRSVLPRS